MPTCLSKFLALGMSLPDVIYAATARPAAVMGMQDEVGTLKPGALADVALFQNGRRGPPLRRFDEPLSRQATALQHCQDAAQRPRTALRSPRRAARPVDRARARDSTTIQKRQSGPAIFRC
ncbi:MAG: amidohydrolase family protein [Caldilineaceae bacterium]